MKTPKVFLGGTCNGSPWRDYVIPKLKILYFNPVVDDWTPDCQHRELKERATADYVVYVITPLMTGVYSIAEAIDDSNKRPRKTIFVLLTDDYDSKFGRTIKFTLQQLKSLDMVASMATSNGATVLSSLDDLVSLLNKGVNTRPKSDSWTDTKLP